MKINVKKHYTQSGAHQTSMHVHAHVCTHTLGMALSKKGVSPYSVKHMCI